MSKAATSVGAVRDADPPSSSHSNDSPLAAQLADDPELIGLTLYEKKAVLVNRELNSHGMGRYQWCIWGLCGFGYFLDLMWAQAFGLALPALIYEFGLYGPNAYQSANLSTSFNAGLTAGAFCWGFLVDIIGRQWAFNGTCLIASIFGLCLGASNSYTTLLVLTAFCGFGVGGNIPIDTTICLEFLPQNRHFLLVLLSLFQPVGVVISSAISYGLIPGHSCSAQVQCGTQAPGQPCCDKDSNYGWRYFLFTLGGITLFVFVLRFLVFNFRESPKYLLYRGYDEKAAKVLSQIARFNKREPTLSEEHFIALNHIGDDSGSGKVQLGAGKAQKSLGIAGTLALEFRRLTVLFNSWGSTYMTILTWVTYMFDYLSFSAAGSYIPQILAAKGAQLDLSTEQTYRNYAIIYTPGIVGALLGGVLWSVPFIGRKWGMVISSALQGVSLFLFATAKTEAAYIGFNVLEYFMQTLFNAILYAWTPEIFAAPIRGTACGVASFFGRIFGIIAPLISGHILQESTPNPSDPGYGNAVLYFAGAVVWVSTICVIAMPGKRMTAQSF